MVGREERRSYDVAASEVVAGRVRRGPGAWGGTRPGARARVGLGYAPDVVGLGRRGYRHDALHAAVLGDGDRWARRRHPLARDAGAGVGDRLRDADPPRALRARGHQPRGVRSQAAGPWAVRLRRFDKRSPRVKRSRARQYASPIRVDDLAVAADL